MENKLIIFYLGIGMCLGIKFFTLLHYAIAKLLFKRAVAIEEKNFHNLPLELKARKVILGFKFSFTDVLFFPDPGLPCKNFFKNKCFQTDCAFLHFKTNLWILETCLLMTRVELSICMYIFTCKDIAEVLVKLNRRNVIIKIITDQSQIHDLSSQMSNLMKNGIRVKFPSSSYLMHHKFAILDNKILLTGSLNWTTNAIIANKENVVITSDAYLVSKFANVFKDLWDNDCTS